MWCAHTATDSAAIENLGGWLTTVVARVCLDMLRSRKARREEPLSLHHVAGNERRARSHRLAKRRPRRNPAQAVADHLPEGERIAGAILLLDRDRGRHRLRERPGHAIVELVERDRRLALLLERQL